MPEEIILIFDKHNKPRKVKNLRKIFHDLPDILGKFDTESVPCVEYLVMGGTVPWFDWMRLDVFKLINPGVEI